MASTMALGIPSIAASPVAAPQQDPMEAKVSVVEAVPVARTEWEAEDFTVVAEAGFMVAGVEGLMVVAEAEAITKA